MTSLSLPKAAPSPRCGIGLRMPHVAEVMATRPALSWVEVHAENYMGGGRARAQLEAIRDHWPVSLHGVGLSLGGAGGIDAGHLAQLKSLVDSIKPYLVSEHLAWCRFNGFYLNDLLPLPYTDESLRIVIENVERVQNHLGRRILIENPSRYLHFSASHIAEQDFLAALVDRTACGLLCDVNNIYVSCRNLGGDPNSWLNGIPAEAVEEIHLAGFHVNSDNTHEILIDDHGSAPASAVWSLYDQAVRRFPRAAALIEWDTNLPALSDLVAESRTADRRRALALEEASYAAAI